jgi:hypothetical protein
MPVHTVLLALTVPRVIVVVVLDAAVFGGNGVTPLWT